MISRLAIIVFVVVALVKPAGASEEIVADLSQRQVPITADFDGSELILYGAVKRETPISIVDPLSVIITVAGPSRPVTVRRKERVAGIWINTDSVEVDLAPSFYAIATSRPLNQILTDTEDLRYKISIPRAIRSVGAPMTVKDSLAFTEALIRIRSNSGVYQFRPNTVAFFDQTLFKTAISLPANLTEGRYKVTLYLTRNGEVVTSYNTNLGVQKVGLERWIYNLAHERPLIYGLFSIFIAIAAGWAASAVFRYFRN